MTDMEMAMIRALAAIDDELGMPQDGCNSTEKTITAIKLLNAIIRDDDVAIGNMTIELATAKDTNANLELSLNNCRLLAARNRKESWALLILGFCAEAGVTGSITR